LGKKESKKERKKERKKLVLFYKQYWDFCQYVVDEVGRLLLLWVGVVEGTWECEKKKREGERGRVQLIITELKRMDGRVGNRGHRSAHWQWLVFDQWSNIWSFGPCNTQFQG